MTAKIYGIKNCDTMQKAFAWLDQHGVVYDFHDYKKAGVTKAQLTPGCRSRLQLHIHLRKIRSLPKNSSSKPVRTSAIRFRRCGMAFRPVRRPTPVPPH
jgi:hypothetical protein